MTEDAGEYRVAGPCQSVGVATRGRHSLNFSCFIFYLFSFFGGDRFRFLMAPSQTLFT